MADYIQTSTYEYILTYFTNNQITEPSIISSTVFDRAKSAQNTPSIYPIKNDEGQNHLDYTYYTHIYNPETNTYSPLQNPTKDVISCAYSFTNITKYYDENHNEFTSQSITKIDTDGTIHINDVGIAQIKTDFYENTYYFIDSTYYNLKVLYPTKLSLRNGDYFNSDPNIVKWNPNNYTISSEDYNLLKDQLIDCTEKFDSDHNVVQNNVFIRFPSRDFIDYKVEEIKNKYNASFEPNYIYKYELSSDIPSEALNIFNELTGTLSLNSYYISNNSFIDLSCRVLYEKDNFFSPYYFVHDGNNLIEEKTSEITFRHYFKKYLPMKYELEDNTYVVYLNEVIEDSLKNKEDSGLFSKYGPTPVTMKLVTENLSISSNNISIKDNTSSQTVAFSFSGSTLTFVGTFGHEYLFSLKNTSYIVGKVYDSTSEAPISKEKFKFVISRNINKSKAIVVQNIFIGTQSPSIDPNITDTDFKQWIIDHENVSISGINIKIGDTSLPPDNPDYVPPVITQQEIEIRCNNSVETSSIGSNLNLITLNTPSIYIKGTNTPVSGLSLTWSSSKQSVAKVVSNNSIKINAEGTTTITVKFAGNDSYKKAETIYTLIVKKPTSSDPIIDDTTPLVHFDNSSEKVTVASGVLWAIQNVTIIPTNWHNSLMGYSVEYTSSDTSIAKIVDNINNTVQDGDSIDHANKIIEIKKEGSVEIKCILKKNSNIVASHKYTLNITIIPPKTAVRFNITNRDVSVDFHLKKISLIKRDNGGYFYTTTFDENSNSTLPAVGRYTGYDKQSGGVNMPELTSGMTQYVTEQDGINDLIPVLEGYIGRESNYDTRRALHCDWGGGNSGEAYNFQDADGINQKIPSIQFNIVARNVNYTGIYNYTAQNPFDDNDNELNIDILNQAYSNENRLITNDIIYGDDGEDQENPNQDTDQPTTITIDGTDIIIEEYGLYQIEEMPELYLPKNLGDENFNKLKYYSSNPDVAQIMYWEYDPNFGIEHFIGVLEGDEKNNNEETLINQITNGYRLKPKLLIHKNGESLISVKYKGDDKYAETTGVLFKLIVKLKSTPQISLDKDKFEIERQLASAIDESIDNEDPISGFQTFQSPTPNVICEESIPVAFEYFSSNNAIGTPYGDLGDILIFDVGTIKVTIKLKETKKYRSTTTSYQLFIKNPPDKTETILNVDQAYHQIRFTQYVDKKIYRVYDAINGSKKHLVFETNLYNDISNLKDKTSIYELPHDDGNIKEYLIENINYDFYYKNSDTPCSIYDGDNQEISSISDYYSFENPWQYSWLFDKLNGKNIPLFDYENVEYCDNFTRAKVRLNCYDVLDEDGNHGYYIYSRGLTSRLKTDSNNFIKGLIPGTYIDKHLKIVIQNDSLGIPDSTYPTYSENFATYGMQIVDIENPKNSKAFRHAFSADLNKYVNNNEIYLSSVKGGCSFYVKPSSISSVHYDWKEKLMFLKDYNDEELNHQIFKSKYTSNNTDEDVEYIFTSSVPEIAKTNGNGDVIIYSSGKVKIMIRSTETENFTSGETGYVLDILPKERPMLEAKYTRYLHEMDATLVENVFGTPDFEWNNSDPDAKLLFWIRNGGPSDNDPVYGTPDYPGSYLRTSDVDGLKFDENNLNDEDWEQSSSDSSKYYVMVALPGQTSFMNIGYASENLYAICKNESIITNIEIKDDKIYLKNCTYKFYSFNGNEIPENEPNLYNMVFKTNGFLNIENSTSFISLQTNYGTDVLKRLTNSDGVINDSYVQDVDGDFIIKFYLNVIPVFDSSKNNFVYCLPEHVNDSSNPYDNVSPREFNGWYYIDPLYIVDENNENKFRIYSNKYRNRYCIKNGQPSSVLDLSSESIQDLIDIVGNVVNTVEPIATVSGALSRNHYYISNQDQDDEDYGSSNNVYAEDNIIEYNQNDIIYGAGKKITKDEFQTELEITKSITYRYIDEKGNVVYTDKEGIPLPEGKDPLTDTKIYHVSVDEAGNVTIENGLIGHVINVLVKSIETDNFKPTYLVYNIVIKSILDRGNNSDGTEQGNGYAVSTSKKTNNVLIDENLIEVRTNPYKSDAKTTYKTVSTPIFSCSSNDPDLSIEYYIYDGGKIDENENEWYATHYFKEFRREWYKNQSSQPAKNIVEIITGKTYQETNKNGEYGEIATVTVTERYAKNIVYTVNDNDEITDISTTNTTPNSNQIFASIDNNGNLKINSFLHDRVINVMIYFTGTSEYYDNCVFYNVKVLTKNNTILTIPQNIFSVAQPYPFSGILQFPEVKTNNTDTDEIKYYITARQVGKLLHDVDTFTEHLDDQNNTITFTNNHGDGLYWEHDYGHYADAFNVEKNNYTTNNYSAITQYEPTNILANNFNYEITNTYPHPINDGSNTLFTIYNNGQIRYTNKAGRYVLNVCVISEETTNFLQGYGFYNLEVEVKDEPTLGVYPPYIEVKVGTKDVYVEAPNIVCSNDDSNATLSFEIHEYVESGGSSVDPHYSAAVYQGSDITVDEVGNITIKGGLFNTYSSSTEKKWWIKVTSNPSPNFGSVWTKFMVCAIPKKLQSISYCPSTILLRPSTIDRTIKSDIKFSNTDEDCILTYTSSNPSNVSIDSFGVMTVYANTTGNTNITITSPETENFRASETTYQFLVSVAEKITPTLTINGGSSSMNLTRTVVTGSEVFAGPTIEHNNTDKEVKIVYISSDTSIMTVTPKGALMVYKTGNVTLTIKVKETENYKEATGTVSINISQQSIPSDTVYGAYSPYTDPGTDPGTGGTTPSSGGTNKIGGMNHLNIYQAGGNSTGSDGTGVEDDTPILYTSAGGLIASDGPYEDLTNYSSSTYNSSSNLCSASGSGNEYIQIGVSNVPSNYGTPTVYKVGVVQNDSGDNNVNIGGTLYSPVNKSDIIIEGSNGNYIIKAKILPNSHNGYRRVHVYLAYPYAGYNDSNWPTDLHSDGVKQHNGIYLNGVYAGSGGSGSGNNVFYVNLGGNAQGYCGDGVIYDFFLQNTINDIPKEQGGDYYRQPVIKVTNNDKAVTLSNLTITDGYGAVLYAYSNAVNTYTFSINADTSNNIYFNCPHINAGNNTGKFINFTLSNGVNTVRCHIRIIREDAL